MNRKIVQADWGGGGVGGSEIIKNKGKQIARN